MQRIGASSSVVSGEPFANLMDLHLIRTCVTMQGGRCAAMQLGPLGGAWCFSVLYFWIIRFCFLKSGVMCVLLEGTVLDISRAALSEESLSWLVMRDCVEKSASLCCAFYTSDSGSRACDNSDGLTLYISREAFRVKTSVPEDWSKAVGSEKLLLCSSREALGLEESACRLVGNFGWRYVSQNCELTHPMCLRICEWFQASYKREGGLQGQLKMGGPFASCKGCSLSARCYSFNAVILKDPC